MSIKVTRKAGPDSKALEVMLKGLTGKVAKVGWLNKAAYLDGTPVAQVAATQEYGDPQKHIPPRSFLRPTITSKKKSWVKIAADGTRAVLRGSITVAQVMEGIGLRAAGDVRAKIASIWSPPLSQVTINARLERRANSKVVGNLDKPLVDSGFMLGTLTNSVENE